MIDHDRSINQQKEKQEIVFIARVEREYSAWL